MGKSIVVASAILFSVSLLAPAARAQQHPGHGMPMEHGAPEASGPAAEDARQAVRFPAHLRERTLANMRDHLSTLQEIQAALAAEAYGRAAAIAEQRLGMDSLSLHGAAEVAGHMPEGMQTIGTGMHRAASRFSLAAQDAGATGDVRPALAALATLTAQCVACHASYRLE